MESSDGATFYNSEGAGLRPGPIFPLDAHPQIAIFYAKLTSAGSSDLPCGQAGYILDSASLGGLVLSNQTLSF